MILLDAALDYAGLFPPASLGMSEAARNYATYRKSAHSGLLGRFVVPLARLAELEAAARDLPVDDGPPWELTVLVAGDPATDRGRIADFQARHEASLSIRSVERKVETVEEVHDVVEEYRGGSVQPLPWDLYLEVPTDPTTVPSVVDAIAAAGAFAKVRTGGTTVDGFPSTDALARFVLVCSGAGVPFKATAGLHHALRGEYRVDHDPGSPCATMHGFMNLFVAAVLLDAGKIGPAELPAILEERAPGAFVPDATAEGAVRWRHFEAGPEEVRRTRTRLLHAFGTCSFEEPVEELLGMGVLRP